MIARAMNKLLLRTLVLCCLAAPAPALAAVTGVVVDVSDGDSVTVRAGGRWLKLGLARVEAPHIGQPFGMQARRSLAALCHGKRAAVDQVVLGRKRSIVARVRCAGIDAGVEQVRRGLAWVLERDAKKHPPLRELEAEARHAHRGLWSDAEPVPPWVWIDSTQSSLRQDAKP